MLSLLPIAVIIRIERNDIAIAIILIAFNTITIIHSFLFPKFYSIITPFFPLFVVYHDFISNISGFHEIGQLLLRIANYGYLIDLVIVLSITGLMSLFYLILKKIHNEKSYKKLIYSFLMVIHLLILLLLPYIIILFSGVVHFGLAYTSGIYQLQEGMDNASADANISQALPYFIDAETKFEEANDLLNGLSSLQFLNFLILINPDFEEVLKDSRTLISSSLILSGAFVPVLEGILSLEDNFYLASSNSIEVDIFNQFSNNIAFSRMSLSIAEPKINEAIDLFQSVDLGQFSRETKELGIGNYKKELLFLNYAGVLFSLFIKMLLIQISPQFDQDEPLSHLLRSYYNMIRVQQIIGDRTRYQNTLPAFSNIETNLTLVNLSFNGTLFPEYDQIKNQYLGNDNLLNSFRYQLIGLQRFFQDFASLGIELANFGKSVVGIVDRINQTIEILPSEIHKFPDLPQTQLDLAITNLQELRFNASQLQEQATQVNNLINHISTRNENRTYGLFTATVKQVLSELNKFDLLTNANNFYHLVSALYYIMLAIREYQSIKSNFNNIQANLTTIENNPSDPALVNQSIINIRSNVDQVNQSLILTQQYLINATYHVNQIENMEEAEQLQDILLELQNSIDNMFSDQNGLIELVNQLDQLDPTNVDLAIISNIQDVLDQMISVHNNVDEIIDDIHVNT